MNNFPHSVRDLIDAWPTRKALADEIGATAAQVHKWAQFGRIPSEWQFPVMQAALRRGTPGITAEWMLRAHAARPDSPQAAE